MRGIMSRYFPGWLGKAEAQALATDARFAALGGCWCSRVRYRRSSAVDIFR